MKRTQAKQLEFKGWGWAKKALAYNDAQAVAELVETAGRYIPRLDIHIDFTENAELWHRSRIQWDLDKNAPVNLDVYYHKQEIRLPILAHEVGHLETLPKLGNLSFYCSSPVNQYHAEVLASRWAVAFLASHGLTGKAYKDAVKLLQGCLDNYRRELNVRIRYILDEAVEASK